MRQPLSKGLVILLAFVPGVLTAEIVTERQWSRISGHLRFIQEEGPDHKREERTAYGLMWTQPIWQRVRLEQGIYFAPDSRSQPRAVRVTDNWYGAFMGTEWSYPWLFRWFVSAGVVAQYERTQIEFRGSQESQSAQASGYQLFPYIRGGVDYAVTEQYEVSMDLGVQDRVAHEHVDWFWSLGFGMNLF
jgi:hypothetical protein